VLGASDLIHETHVSQGFKDLLVPNARPILILPCNFKPILRSILKKQPVPPSVEAAHEKCSFQEFYLSLEYVTPGSLLRPYLELMEDPSEYLSSE
jgi:hypothetical protein